MAKAKAHGGAIRVAYDLLCSLLGKQPDDPAVTAMIAKAGKVTVKSDFIIAKEAGFDFSLGRPPGAKKKVLTSLFLFREGNAGHRGYPDLPSGFAFTTRSELLAKVPAPQESFKIGKGTVPVSTPDVSHDTWIVDGRELTASYRDGNVGHINIALPADQMGGRDLSTHPLHFESRPPDAPADAELVGMALLVAWAATKHGLPAKHAASPLGKQLLARKITPREFLVGACAKTLTSLDVAPALGDFLHGYTHRLFTERDQANAAIAKLLHLHRADERAYPDDFLGTFKHAVDNPFHVPDSWAAVDRIAPVLDARWADYQATRFARAPDLKLYEKAAKARDARAVSAARADVAPAAADAGLAEELVGLIDRALKDPHVKTVLTRAGMPIGKKIDQQANPALGIAYMGTKFEIDGKKELGVDAVYFFAAKQKSYIRGIGGEVEFAGYPGPLPHGLVLGESRAAVAKKLGKPTKTYEDNDYWTPSTNRKLACTFAKGKLVELYIGRPRDY
jgi:hypothetical protein